MRTASYRPGAVLALVLFCVYGGLALSVDFPRAAIGFQSDEATYYMMGHSLAHDGDLTYRREDLVRVWREFPAGPAGVFLKRGRDVDGLGLHAAAAVRLDHERPDPDPSRYYYGKSFIYPLFAAPFVRVFGTNGFLRAPRAAARAGGLVQLPVPARADARVARRHAGRRLS